MRPIESMSPEELVLEADRLRKEARQSAERLMCVGDLLHSKARRDNSDITPALLRVSSANKRYANTILVSDRQVVTACRIFNREKERAEQAARKVDKPSEQKVSKKESFRKGLFQPFDRTASDLDALYGEEQ